MVLFLNEKEVTSLLTMNDAIEAVEAALRDEGLGKAANRPRQRVLAGQTMLHVLTAAVPRVGSLGLKAYTTGPAGANSWLLLFSESGKLEAIMEAGRLGQVRTGAASGVATKWLSREDSSSVGIIGTGYQARTQLEAVCEVRPITHVRAWSRNPEHVAAFSREMSALLDVAVEPAASARAAITGADIAITMTSARDPVLHGEWLAKGMHLNITGSNNPRHSEADVDTVRQAGLIVTDDVEQAKGESGDLIKAAAAGALDWSAVKQLSGIIAGTTQGRGSGSEITLFKSNGIGLWDVAVAARVFELALDRGKGTRLEMGSRNT
jgi:ornithine cyclodeaminase/alanine dehydrogenase